MRNQTIITCHQNADFDALCSCVGALTLFPNAQIFFPGTQEMSVQEFYEEIIYPLYPCIDRKELDKIVEEGKDLNNLNMRRIKRLVIVDTSQSIRVPHVAKLLEDSEIEVYVWDHHPDGDLSVASENDTMPMGNYAMIGATCTLLTEDIKAKFGKVSCETASILGLGIYVDTGSFNYNSTTSRDFNAISWLMEQGFDTAFVRPFIRQDISREHLKVLNTLLESSWHKEINGIHFTIVSVQTEEYLHDFAMLAPRIMGIQPCHVLFMLGGMDSKIQIVARSNSEYVDVGAFCKLLGGGGHKYAAAATVKDKTMAEVKDFLGTQISIFSHTDKTAKRLMTHPVVGLMEEHTIGEADKTMAHYGIKAIPIFKKNTRLCVGWIEHQMASKANIHGLGKALVSDYMQRNFQVVSPNASMQKLMDIIVGKRQRLIPVVDIGTRENLKQDELKKLPVLGVITRTDMIRLFLDDQNVQEKSSEKKKRNNVLGRLRSRCPVSCFQLLERIRKIAAQSGVNVYVVGGFVRDILLSKKKRFWPDVDIDLVVEGDGISFAHELAKELNGRVREHQEFMTALILFPASAIGESFTQKSSDGKNLEGKGLDLDLRIDVATARLEYYTSPAALPTVELSSLKMDLYRRDFTINAMAISLTGESFGELVDFFDGQSDIKQKKIRMLHALSFVEDPTRSLRAIRFEQRYQFEIGLQCGRLIRNAIELGLIEKLSGKRIVHELELILKEENPYACLLRLQDFGILEAMHPTFSLSSAEHKTFLEESQKILQWYNLLYMNEKISLFSYILLALCRSANLQVVEEVLYRLDFDTGKSKSFLSLRQNIIATNLNLEKWRENKSNSELYKILKDVPLEGILYVMTKFTMQGNEDMRKDLAHYVYQIRNEKADLLGSDIMASGVPSGPLIGKLLEASLFAKLDGIAVSREEQLSFVQDYLAQINNI